MDNCKKKAILLTGRVEMKFETVATVLIVLATFHFPQWMIP
jgi:hypothetical protein